jgi:hypothetical protein
MPPGQHRQPGLRRQALAPGRRPTSRFISATPME